MCLGAQEGGPNAEARFEAGVAGYEARAFRGCGVFTSEPVRLHRIRIRPAPLPTPPFGCCFPTRAQFEVSDDSDAVQMLTRNTQVGEFYYMHPPKNVSGNWKPGMCNMILYDEEADKHVPITWEQAMKATMVAAANGYIGTTPAPVMAGPAAATTTEDWYDLANAWNQLNKGVQISALASAGIAASGDPPTQDQMNAAYKALSAAKNEVPYIAVTRPFIEHMMHSVILTVAGRDTGATLFGPSDMQLSANTQVKTIEGHYTGHFKAVITKPQNVLVMRDVAAAGYVAGGNCLFFAAGKDGAGATTYLPSTCKENLAKRLAFSDDVGARYRSMLSFPMFESQLDDSTTCLDTVMSVTSRLLPWEVQGTVANGKHTSFPGGEAVFTAYNSLLGLRSIHFGEDMKAAENQDFISQARHSSNIRLHT